MKPDGGVIFFDFQGVLFDRSQTRYRIHIATQPLLNLSARHRLGILCNLPPGLSPDDFRLLLKTSGLEAHFELDLIVLASGLPCPLPDRRAFAAAAAIAEVAPGNIIYVTADPALALEAKLSGFQVQDGPRGAPTASVSTVLDLGGAPALLAEVAPVIAVEPQLLAQVDEDTGPTFVLRGRIVTLNGSSEVLAQGQLAIRRGKIVAVLKQGDALPSDFARAPQIDTGATLYPGLIDLHNHFVYNVLPLWNVPKKYDNRKQWPGHKEYKSNISQPARAMAAYTPTARAIVRYVEAKALIGGTTTGQGIKTQVSGGIRLFRGAMRNVEKTEDVRLPDANTLVPDLFPTPDRVESFRKNLKRYKAYFYHLSEGTNDDARQRFLDLSENNLLAESLVGIHALGLSPADLKKLGNVGGKVVSSPFSNLLLYGKTLDLKAMREADLTFSLGCDWSPSGSKNLLEELKVARWVSKQQNNVLSNEDLVRLVTSEAAKVTAWDGAVGMLKEGFLADILAVGGTDGDPYQHLLNATEEKVQLVIVHGVARYGDAALMQQLRIVPQAALEQVTIGSTQKAFYFDTPFSELNGLTFSEARSTLKTAMDDLPLFVLNAKTENNNLLAMGLGTGQPFTLPLDMEEEGMDETGFVEASLLADFSKIAPRLELDSVEVKSDAYFALLDNEVNLDKSLAKELRNAYPG